MVRGDSLTFVRVWNGPWRGKKIKIQQIIILFKIYNPGILLGAQWLSGRVLDSRPKGRGFEPHGRHCVVVLEQDTFILA